MLDRGDNIFLVDVREPNEYEIVSIPGATLIPKDQFLTGAALEKLPQDKQIVLHCKSGVRSAECLAIVKGAGSPMPCTSAAACWPGSTRWTRACLPTKAVWDRGGLALVCTEAVNSGCDVAARADRGLAAQPRQRRRNGHADRVAPTRLHGRQADGAAAASWWSSRLLLAGRPGGLAVCRRRDRAPAAAAPVHSGAAEPDRHLGDGAALARPAGRDDLPGLGQYLVSAAALDPAAA